MEKEVFDELLESMREGGAILRGEREPSRRFIIEEPEVRVQSGGRPGETNRQKR